MATNPDGRAEHPSVTRVKEALAAGGASRASIDGLRLLPDAVTTATGQVIGGVAPVGHPAPLRTLIDRALARFDVVWAAGGVARAVFGDDVRRARRRHRRDARRRGLRRYSRPAGVIV